MNAKLKIGDKFEFCGAICTITTVDKFGCTPHYGFTYQDSNGNYQGGWMPVEFVDKGTGHIQ